MGVLVYEIGYVIYCYSLLSIYQGLGLILLIIVVIGDLIGVSIFVVVVLIWLLKNGYLCQFEIQFDEVVGCFLMECYGIIKLLCDVFVCLEIEDENVDENSVKCDDFGVFFQIYFGIVECIWYLCEIEQNWLQCWGK